MVVGGASVDDGDLGTLAKNAGGVQLVDTRHAVDRVIRRRRVVGEGHGWHRRRLELHLATRPYLCDAPHRFERVDVVAGCLNADAREGLGPERAQNPQTLAAGELATELVMVRSLLLVRPKTFSKCCVYPP